jgi:hypothetical protein
MTVPPSGSKIETCTVQGGGKVKDGQVLGGHRSGRGVLDILALFLEGEGMGRTVEGRRVVMI